MRSSALALAFAALVGCTGDGDVPDPYLNAALHAQNVRGLTFEVVPPSRTITVDQYHAEATQNATQLSDADIERILDSYGRLGFYPRNFDLRGAAQSRADLYAAYYRPDTKSVTLVGNPDHRTIVHELVHGLQDQHFDLSKVQADTLSTDGALARSALIEGDAELSEFRDDVVDQGDDAVNTIIDLRAYVTPSFAAQLAAKEFSASPGLPKIQSAQAAFAYGYGTYYIATKVGVATHGSYDTSQSNALFTGAAMSDSNEPHTTQEILRVAAGLETLVQDQPDFDALPGFMADYEIDFTDRIGAWLTNALLSATTTDVSSLVLAWQGDRLLFLRRKDGAGTAIVWVSRWQNANAAASFAGLLDIVVPQDSEHAHLEQVGRDVFFSKNLDEALASRLALFARDAKAEQLQEALQRPNVSLFPLLLAH